jgi:hypothetical protein
MKIDDHRPQLFQRDVARRKEEKRFSRGHTVTNRRVCVRDSFEHATSRWRAKGARTNALHAKVE